MKDMLSVELMASPGIASASALIDVTPYQTRMIALTAAAALAIHWMVRSAVERLAASTLRSPSPEPAQYWSRPAPSA